MEQDKPQGPAAEHSLPSPKSTNNEDPGIAATMSRMSLGTAAATKLPPSSPGMLLERRRSEVAPPSPLKLRRPPSSQSLASPSRPTTPSLHKKSSLSSLKGTGTSTPPRSPVVRRVSSNLALSRQPGMPTRAPLAPSAEEPTPPPITAASVAKEFLERDIGQHKDSTEKTNLVVILHDACYGHRFSRPKTSKASLSTIVERPERILATVLGVCSAYVLLGGRHVAANNAPHPLTQPGRIPFKIQKSGRFVPLVSPAVTNVHGTKWMSELKMMCEGAESKLATNGKELVRPTAQFGEDEQEEKPRLHEGDLYLCSESLNALEGSLGGVFDAVDAVFDPSGPKRAFVAIRPPGHHCSANYPSGFCWINNVHVGISHATAVHGLTHAAIIDFDLHHGDGSQTITWAHNAKVAALPKNAALSRKTAIGYFSLHDINSYPCEWGDEEKVKNASLCIENAHGQTIWNVHLQPWKTDADFWHLYETRYLTILEKTRDFFRHHYERLRSSHNAPEPRAAIFISAGFDASEWEGQGMQRHKVNVPTDFYARFTRDINNLANEEGLGVDGRVISVLEGGYSDRALTSGVLSHLAGMADPTSSSVKATYSALSTNGLGHEMGQKLGMLKLEESAVEESTPASRSILFDTNWWSPSRLEDLENLVNPPPAAAPKKPRGPINPNFTTPTQSFAAKMHIPAGRRSMSSSLGSPKRVPIVQSPPPEVDWAVASYELSKILKPDRQTDSCKPEDLNAEATRIRRDRQSVVGAQVQVLPENGKRMQLRGRKAKVATAEPESRSGSRTSRRKTIGGVTDGESDENSMPQSNPPRRRVSVASTILSTAEEVSELQPAPPPPARRISSSSSVLRPASTASSRSNLPVDKSRAKPRSPPKQRAPKKLVAASQPPVPALPSASTKPSKSAAASKPEQMDSLTSGVKKLSIKLNVPPKIEQSAREVKLKATRAPRKAPGSTKVPKETLQPSAPPSTLPAASASLQKEAELQGQAYPPVQVPALAPATAQAPLPFLPPAPAPASMPFSASDQTSSHVPTQFITQNPNSTTSGVPIGQTLESEPPEQQLPQRNLQATLSDRIGHEIHITPPEPSASNGENDSFQQPVPPSCLPPNAVSIPAPVVNSMPAPAMPAPTSTLPQAATSTSVFQPATNVTNGNFSPPTAQPPVVPSPTTAPFSQPPVKPSTPKRSREDLPVFTATSPLLFGPPKHATANLSQALATEIGTQPSKHVTLQSDEAQMNGAKREPDDIWEVPDTPQRKL